MAEASSLPRRFSTVSLRPRHCLSVEFLLEPASGATSSRSSQIRNSRGFRAPDATARGDRTGPADYRVKPLDFPLADGIAPDVVSGLRSARRGRCGARSADLMPTCSKPQLVSGASWSRMMLPRLPGSGPGRHSSGVFSAQVTSSQACSTSSCPSRVHRGCPVAVHRDRGASTVDSTRPRADDAALVTTVVAGHHATAKTPSARRRGQGRSRTHFRRAERSDAP